MDTQKGFFAATTARRTNVTVSFDDISYLRPGIVRVTDGTTGAVVDSFSLSSYVMTAATGAFRGVDDLKRTAYANVSRDFYGAVPLSLKGGLDLRQSVRDSRNNDSAWSFVGADSRTSTMVTSSDDLAARFLDPGFSLRAPPYGFPPIQGVAPDNLNMLPVLLGENRAVCTSMITQSYTGVLAIREGTWKLILDTKGSGGHRATRFRDRCKAKCSLPSRGKPDRNEELRGSSRRRGGDRQGVARVFQQLPTRCGRDVNNPLFSIRRM